MKDRFKFRAFDKNKKIMIYDAERTYDGLCGVEDWNSFVDVLNDDNYIVEQCTGLKDKNGKLIYEGDILQDCEQKIKVVFDEERHCFMFEYQKTYAYKPIYCLDVLDGDFEVIGNIHENGDLLNEALR